MAEFNLEKTALVIIIIMEFKNIDIEIKALNEELYPLFKEIGEIRKVTDLLGDEKKTPLKELISRVTATARKHMIEKKIKFTDEGRDYAYEIGTNHQGVGYESSWSSQLSPVAQEGRSWGGNNEQYLRDILFDDEATIELTSVIKKSNQKTFLQVLKILKKYDLKQAFKTFKEKEVDKISIEIDEKNKLIVELNRYSDIEFYLNCESSYSYNRSETKCRINQSEDNCPTLIRGEEENEIKNKYSSVDYGSLDLSELKVLCYIAENKDKITDGINNSKEKLLILKEKYEKEQKELNKILEPFLALEQL